MSIARNALSRLVPSRIPAFVRDALGARLATEAGRFKLAVASGFVIASVGFLVVGVGTKLGTAASIFGAMEIAIPGEVASRPIASPQYYTPRRERLHVAEARHPKKMIHLARTEAAKFRASSEDEESGSRPMSLSGKSLCVRLCDGFAFPVGDYHGSGDRAAHQATCQSECPGARTALFVMPAGSDQIADATQVGTGKNYSEMPDAFHYTTFINESCSCHPQSGNRLKSILHDFTLRRGDSVMTSKGLQVFHGGASFPFKKRDFVILAHSRDIRTADRAKLDAIQKASLVRPTTVASAPRAAPPRAVPTAAAATKGLEHQASN